MFTTPGFEISVRFNFVQEGRTAQEWGLREEVIRNGQPDGREAGRARDFHSYDLRRKLPKVMAGPGHCSSSS